MLLHGATSVSYLFPCDSADAVLFAAIVGFVLSAVDCLALALALGMKGEGSVDISVTDGYYSDYAMTITYYFSRYETDAERERREVLEDKLKDEARKKRRAADQLRKLKNDPEYAEFERLKAKFGV